MQPVLTSFTFNILEVKFLTYTHLREGHEEESDNEQCYFKADS